LESSQFGFLVSKTAIRPTGFRNWWKVECATENGKARFRRESKLGVLKTSLEQCLTWVTGVTDGNGV